MRYVGVRFNKICVISETPIQNATLEVIEVPSELSHISSNDLFTRCRFKDGKLICKLARKPAKQMKVAFVGNWKQKCGISTFAEKLFPEIAAHLGDFKMFIEENDEPTGDIYSLGKDKVVVCWKRGLSTQKLSDAIKDYDPDIVWINHEWGMWFHAGHWLALMSQLSHYRVITTMHSVFRHQDKTICEAAMPEIVVHLEGGKKVLEEEKFVSGKVIVIPHGCEPYDGARLWNMYRSQHTVIQSGFLHSYKGWEEALRVIALLKLKYPDVFFTGICSDSPSNQVEQQNYFNELLKLVNRLDIQENVCLIKGFQSDQVMDSYLRTNRVGLFPYGSQPGHEVFGVSGAARVAMSKGLPVVSSNANHFQDIPSMKGATIEEMAAHIDRLFSEPKIYQEQVERQIAYIANNTWEKAALRYVELFERGCCD